MHVMSLTVLSGYCKRKLISVCQNVPRAGVLTMICSFAEHSIMHMESVYATSTLFEVLY